ncbi:hypothetical protein [Mitsuaria sp. GD03876]|uniref:hypothetical protein n=1 Tax=Mitsuaria sp. GD03876 TaxID=2975399 RepID=UPI00244D3E57|nr:hypothetical protein [Mitsuaria sp. GD03876]MDH0866699.1 hypothetical protein [Mitsuaria sp. GD03876]
MSRNEFDEMSERYELLAQQSRLVDAVLAPEASDPTALAPSGLRALPGLPGGLPQALSAYRADARAQSEQALAAVYPRLRGRMEARVAGSFAALAWACWCERGPAQGDLGAWGEVLAERLAADATGTLPDAWTALARIEWDLHRVQRIADPVQDLGSLALLGRLPAGAVRVVLADHVALHRCDAPALAELLELPDERFGAGPAAGLIVWRDGWHARLAAVDEAVLRWCEMLRAGADLEHALRDASLAFDFSAWLPAAVARGWLTRIDPVEMAVSGWDTRR